MRHGSLFTGIGGFDLAADWMGYGTVFQVEIDEFCTKILEKHWPNVKRYKDIRKFDGTKYRGAIDIISGGFPCQPFSQAGKRQGEKDNRYLWPEMFRVIKEVKPTFVVGENVVSLISLENGKILERIFFDLENEGYTVESFIIPACSIGAWHRRDRIWIIAYTDKYRLSWKLRQLSSTQKEKEKYFKTLFTQIWERNNLSESSIIRTNDGIPNRMDRLKALGNAIVPQIAYELFKAIDEINNTQ